MTDTCRVYALSATGTLDPATGQIVRTETPIYTGKCRVKAEVGTSVGDVAAGETGTSRVTPVVSLPIAADTVRAGHRVEVLTSTDPGMTGRRLLVRAVQPGSFVTARRLICEIL
jgi:hypothetical protein